MNDIDTLPCLSILAPASLLSYLDSNNGVITNVDEVRDAVRPWKPSKTMLTLAGSMVLKQHEGVLCGFIEGQQLLLQENAIDTISQWAEGSDSSTRSMKKRVSQVLDKASVINSW